MPHPHPFSIPPAPTMNTADRQLVHMLARAIGKARPEQVVPHYLPPAPAGRTLVLGAGKASAVMAQTLEKHWSGPLSGFVVTPYGYAAPCQQIDIMEAAHPIPDQASQVAAQRMLSLAQKTTADDLIIMLISGGGSALLCAPAQGLSFQEKQAIHQQLLHSGANIREINCVRRHLSAIKGGHLAQVCAPTPVHNLIISDVPGDSLVDIASGPTVYDPSDCRAALAVLDRYAITLSADTRAALQAGHYETPKPKNRNFNHVHSQLIATAQQSLSAAQSWAQKQGIQVLNLGDSIQGESQEVAKVLAGIAHSIKNHHTPIAPPCILLSGGETTVTVNHAGQGGPNVEFLLSLLLALNGLEGVHALAADTDGVDGACPIAGAWINEHSLAKAWQQGLSPQQYLDNNDAHRFFKKLEQQIITGPTHTNVNDFRALFITH